MAIEGTWQGETTGALLTIYSDGRIVIEGAAGLEAGTIIKGTMERGFDEILITYTTPTAVCGSATGLYRISRKDNQLILETLREDCPSREQHLDKVWTLKSAIPAAKYK